MSLFERSQKLRPIPAAKEENQTGGVRREKNNTELVPKPILQCLENPTDPKNKKEISRYIQSLFSEQNPTIEDWKLPTALYAIQRGRCAIGLSVEQSALKYCNDSDFFEDFLKDFYPFLNYLKHIRNVFSSLGLILNLKSFYNASYSDENYYPFVKLQNKILEILNEGKKVRLTVDFDDTLSLGGNGGIPNFGLINLLKTLDEISVEFEILTSRLEGGVPEIREFVKKYFGKELKITHSNIYNPDERQKEKFRNLVQISNDYKEYINIHIDDYESPEIDGEKPGNVIWVIIPYVAVISDQVTAWCDFQNEEERVTKEGGNVNK
jgi:hypothetical protein